MRWANLVFKTVTISHSDTPPQLSSTTRRILSNHLARPAARIDVRSLVEGFLLDCRGTGKSQATIGYYTEKLGKFLWFAHTCRPPLGIDSITPSRIREFLTNARTTDRERWGSKVASANQPASPATIERLYSCLRVVFDCSGVKGRLAFLL